MASARARAHPLLLTPRQLVRVATAQAAQADHLQQLVGVLPRFLRAAERCTPKATLAATVRWGKSAPSWGT